jgi:hypothetical protein
MDYRGAGRSDRPKDPSRYSLDILAGDVEARRRHLGQLPDLMDQRTRDGFQFFDPAGATVLGRVQGELAQEMGRELMEPALIQGLPVPRADEDQRRAGGGVPGVARGHAFHGAVSGRLGGRSSPPRRAGRSG